MSHAWIWCEITAFSFLLSYSTSTIKWLSNVVLQKPTLTEWWIGMNSLMVESKTHVYMLYVQLPFLIEYAYSWRKNAKATGGRTTWIMKRPRTTRCSWREEKVHRREEKKTRRKQEKPGGEEKLWVEMHVLLPSNSKNHYFSKNYLYQLLSKFNQHYRGKSAFLRTNSARQWTRAQLPTLCNYTFSHG